MVIRCLALGKDCQFQFEPRDALDVRSWKTASPTGQSGDGPGNQGRSGASCPRLCAPLGVRGDDLRPDLTFRFLFTVRLDKFLLDLLDFRGGILIERNKKNKVNR